jgi:glycosyltransferase involved in cell wall biosynthesis
MPKLIFINRYFYPDGSATSQLLTDLASEMAQGGVEVHVVAGPPKTQGAADPDAEKAVRPVTVHQAWTTGLARFSVLGRILDILVFFVTASVTLWRVARPRDLVVIKTDPPLFTCLATPIARLRRAVTVNWLQDLYPEVAQYLGPTWLLAPVFAMFEWLRNWALMRAVDNVVICRSMGAHLAHLGISNISEIPNWAIGVDPSQVTFYQQAAARLRIDWGLAADAFVVGYSGNLGRAHEWRSFVEAAELLRNHENVHFLFVGGGVAFDRLREAVETRRLRNVSFRPHQPLSMLGASLSVPDVHLVSLNPGLEGLIFPSKLYGALGVGAAIVHVGDADGDVATVLETNKVGLTVPPGDSAALAEALLRLANEPEMLSGLRKHALKLARTQLNRERSIQSWLTVCRRHLQRPNVNVS